ncbi:MAG: formylglycine-generating enzyme family protein [Treponema sp.]|nr:formylglycine-generating enzyme family protein [Treponema sp.]
MNRTIFLAIVVLAISALALTACANKPAAKTADEGAVLLAKLETAVPNAFAKINAALPDNLKPDAAIAVFPVTADSADYAELVLENLTVHFVNAGYTVVEKRRVEELLAEYDFQRSGMVGEPTLGELLGADAVIFSILNDDGQVLSWAVDTLKRTTLAQSPPRPETAKNVVYPPVPSIRNDPERPSYKLPIDTYKEMLEVWGKELAAIAQANPSAPFADEPTAFGGSYHESGRGTVYFNDQDARAAAREAWQTAKMQAGRTGAEIILPIVTGGSNNEAETIASFLAYGKYTKNESLATIKQIGRKNMLILGASEDVGRSRPTRFLEYADALELWVKLQSPPPPKRSTLASLNANIWSQYGAGVNRAEAETLTQILILDTLSIPYQNAVLRSFVDATHEYEAGLTQLPRTAKVEGIEITNPAALALQWREYVKTPQFTAGDYYDNRNARYGMMELAAFTKTTAGQNYVYYFDWSRRGNRTRLDVGKTYMNVLINNGQRYYWRYSIEFGSTQEFLSKMRGLSLFIMMRLTSPNQEIWGLDGYDLSTAVVPAPVPANFTKLTSVRTQQGAPMSGFYISNAPVTQREFENIMKQNPSRVKNPTQPVSNVSIIEAMMYCNQISIRDGLEPAYLIEYDLKDRTWRTGLLYHDFNSITIDPFASGYRLATTEEWRFARNKIEGMGVLANEYVFDGNFVKAINGVEGTRTGLKAEDAARTMVAGEDSDIGRAIRIDSASFEYETAMRVRPAYEEIVSDSGDRARTVRLSPVIRVVRPVFDYWKFTSGQ